MTGNQYHASSASASRRTVLKSAAAAAAASTSIGLGACSSEKKEEKTAGSVLGTGKDAIKLPTYKAFEGPKPDIPGTGEGLDPTYFSFPKSDVQSVKGTPASGNPVTALGWTDSSIPTPMNKNSFWQELNKRLGAEFKFDITADYPTKFNTTIAGGNIPELVWFPPNQGLTHVPELLEAKFLDLTQYLSGDAVLDYPNLANLGDFCWKTAVVSRKIRGVAISHGIFGQILECNKTMWDKVGGTQAKDADEFLDKLKELTSPSAKVWACMPLGTNFVHRFGDFFGMPNSWRLQDGKLTYWLETDEYQAALEYTLKANKAGVFHPDKNADPYEVLFPQGSISMLIDDMPGFLLAKRKYGAVNPDFEISGVVPFSADGKVKPSAPLGHGSLGFTAISKSVTDPERVKMLLRVLDYFAAPFGTQEYLFLHYGDEGKHFNYDKDGAPQLTDLGRKETSLNNPIGYLSQGPEFNYQGTFVEHAKYINSVQEELLKIAVPNPVAGYYSPTLNNKASKLPNVGDVIDGILRGNKPMSALEQIRKDWRAKGGDKIRGEYEEAIAGK